MNLNRIARHLISDHRSVRRHFPKRSLTAIEEAIRKVEKTHRGEIRFAVEAALRPAVLWRGLSARERAVDVFSRLRVWDTEENCGVLVYLLLADRRVEIVADRGIHQRAGQTEWERICREMEAAFREGRFEEGVIAGVHAIGEHLKKHYPASEEEKRNELPDRPVVL
ncbi:MAG: TPM domain-containing protein [Nitrospirae bacterium]|nr:TPM domain-containing protein [Nitrospirota bacterium]